MTMRDRRGFRYALEAVRTMTTWDIDNHARTLAGHHAAVRSQQEKTDRLSAALGTARQAVLAGRQDQARIDIDAQRIAHAYMVQVQAQLVNEREVLRELEKERDATLSLLVEARKLAEGLDRNKESAAAEHDLLVAKRDYQQADDSWLQRMHWRKPQ